MSNPSYDTNNIFARILRGEIPCQRVLETPYALAFRDIHPQAPVHILVIPKGAYIDMGDFATRADANEQAGFVDAIGCVIRQEGLGQGGYRVISNCGANGGQEVPHLHMHILGGKRLGRMLPDAS